MDIFHVKVMVLMLEDRCAGYMPSCPIPRASEVGKMRPPKPKMSIRNLKGTLHDREPDSLALECICALFRFVFSYEMVRCILLDLNRQLSS